jgi:O-antigen/teichoic acid export membrane protein
VAYPVYLHYLDYDLFGVWLILSTVLAFAQLGNLQIGPAVMKFVAEEHGRGNLSGIARYTLMALLALAVTGTLALAVLYLGRTPIVALFKLSADHAALAKRLLPYVGGLCLYAFLTEVLEAALSGLGRIDQANYTRSASRIIGLGVSGLLLARGGGIESLLIGNFLSYVLIHVANLYFIRRIVPVRFLRRAHWDLGHLRKLVAFGTGVFGGALLNLFLSPLHRILLSRYAGVATVPIYELAYTGSMQFRNLLESGLRALTPEISRVGALAASDTRDQIRRIYRRALRFVLLWGIPAYGVLLVTAAVLLKTWLRDRYVEGLPGPFRILLAATFLSLLGVPAYYTFLGLGRIRQVFLSHVLQMVVSVAILVAVLAGGAQLTVARVSWATLAGMGACTAYLMWQKHLLLHTERGTT